MKRKSKEYERFESYTNMVQPPHDDDDAPSAAVMQIRDQLMYGIAGDHDQVVPYLY